MERSEKQRARRAHRVLWAVAVGVPLLGLGSVWTLSYSNTITPQGIIVHHSAVTIARNEAPVDVRLLDAVHQQRGYGVFYRSYAVAYTTFPLSPPLPQGGERRGRQAAAFLP